MGWMASAVRQSASAFSQSLNDECAYARVSRLDQERVIFGGAGRARECGQRGFRIRVRLDRMPGRGHTGLAAVAGVVLDMQA
jgi:hypothetical protein